MARTGNLLQSNLMGPTDRLDEVARLLATYGCVLGVGGKRPMNRTS